MVETLIAVAILVILMAVAFVGVLNYRRGLKQIEMDNAAKEIFVAAQNHLAVAESQGVLERLADTGSADEEKLKKIVGVSHTTDGATLHYFFVALNEAPSSGTVLYEMLPPFSLDDTVRTGGSYVIEYDLDSATVTNVFYSDSSSGLDAHSFVESESEYRALFGSNGYTGADKKDKRRNGFGDERAIIGWYGGDDAKGLTKVKLYAPQVSLINAECLEARVSLSTDAIARVMAYTDVNAEVLVYMKGKTSSSLRLLDRISLGTFSVHSTLDTSGKTPRRYMSYILDDITVSGKHFAEGKDANNIKWCTAVQNSDVEKALLPGEDITIYAVMMTNSCLANIPQSNEATENSLYGELKLTSSDEDKTVGISNMRHLENLDPKISGCNLEVIGTTSGNVVSVHAEQTNNLQWAGNGASDSKAFLDTIHANKARIAIYKESDLESTASEIRVTYLDSTLVLTAGTFAPVNTAQDSSSYVLNYEGKEIAGNIARITDVKVDTTGAAGIFGTLPSGSSVSNLELVDCAVATSGGNAGALLGEASGALELTNILVRHEGEVESAKVSGATSVGGLVGSIAGDSLTVKVNGCAAAVRVEATGTDGTGAVAGGLVGACTGSNVTISNSYAGGHTTNGAYDAEKTDVTAAGGTAGGLVGSATGATITACYATTSVSGGTNAGGLVGSASGGVVDKCYATGLVSGDASNKGAFAGTVSDGTEFKTDAEGNATNRYFEIINESMPAVDSEDSTPAGISALDESVATYNQFFKSGDEAADAKPYDTPWLTDHYSKYPYPSVVRLSASEDDDDDEELEAYFVATHYGDWPSPETFVVNAKTS